MRLGLNLGYSGAGMSLNVELVKRAEALGFDSVWSAEAYGSDAISPLGYLAALTSKIKLGTAVMQMPARTPAMTAMTAMTLDQLSGGRFILGLGPSGPQVVEGWHGVPTANRSSGRANTSTWCARSSRAKSPSSTTASTMTSPTRGRIRVGWASRSRASCTAART